LSALLEKTIQMIQLTSFEFKKLFLQKRFHSGISIILIMTMFSAIAVCMRVNSEISRKAEMIATILQKYVNGINFSMLVLLSSILIILPMIVGIFAVCSFAGEYQFGQIRTMALRPVSRFSIFFAKFLSLSIFSGILLIILMIISYTAGAFLFGWSGDIYVTDPGVFGKRVKDFFMDEHVAWIRFFLLYLFALFSLMSFVALFLMCSAVFKKTATAIVVPLGIYFTCYVIGFMPLMEKLRPFLPTRYIFVFKHFLTPQVDWSGLCSDCVVLVLFTAAYILIGSIFFSISDL